MLLQLVIKSVMAQRKKNVQLTDPTLLVLLRLTNSHTGSILAFLLDLNQLLELRWDLYSFNCLWLSVVRQPLTIQQIDTMYWIELQDQLYKTFPEPLFLSPTIVVFSALTLLLPPSDVFAPGSFTVVTKNSTHRRPCMIPTGDSDLSTFNFNSDDAYSLYNDHGFTPRATDLNMQ